MSFAAGIDPWRGAALGVALALALSACAPSDPLEQARARQAAGDFVGSLELLRPLVSERPDDAEILFRYGAALSNTGQPSLAAWSLRRAMEDPQWLELAGLQLAAVSLATGNHGSAIEATGRVLEAHPENLEAVVQRANAKIASRRDYEGALADADRALELDPDHHGALIARAVSLLYLVRTEEAEQALADLDQRVSEAELGLETAAQFCLARSIFEKEKGNLEAAEQRLDQCLADFPSNPRVIQESVAYQDERRRPERALEILRGALALEPRASAWRVSLAARLVAAGKPEEAEQLLLEGTQAKERWLAAVSFVDLANFYSDRDDAERAADALGQAIELSDDPRLELRFQHAEALLAAGRLERARELSRELPVPAYRELIEARALLAEGKPTEALKHFDEGLRLWPDNAVGRYYAARAAEATGDFDRAVEEYRYSIRAGPAYSDARHRLARLHEAEGAVEAALTAARQRTSTLPVDPEAERVGLRVLARAGRLADARRIVAAHAHEAERVGPAVAAVAEGVRDRRGPADAARLVRESERLDLTEPRNALALRELVISLIASGDPAAALTAADAALAKQTDVAEFHALRGQALAARGDAAAARAAYEQALLLDAKHAPALAGLARLAVAEGEREAALGFYASAAGASRQELGDMEPRREWAELLVSLGRREEAEARLSELIEFDPYDGRAAARLAELRLERGDHGDEVLALARRAVRFGGRPESWDLLAGVFRARGEAEPADAALAQAKRARSGQRDAGPAEPEPGDRG